MWADKLDEEDQAEWGRDWPFMPNLARITSAQALGLGFPPSGKKADLVLFASLVTNLLLAHDVGRWVSYSRNGDHYERLKRYRPPEYTLYRMRRLIELLLELGLIEEERQVPGCFGVQSRIKATQQLVSNAGRVSLPRSASMEVIELRDADRHPRPYTDRPAILRMRAEVETLNENIGLLGLGHPELDLDAPLLVVGDATIIPWKRALRRIFKPDFETGGRLYGGFWQQMPKAIRARLLIDGEAVEEPDFVSLHPRLLYAMHGLELSGDAYQLPGTLFDRRIIKEGWMRAVNARSRTIALASLRKDFPERTELELAALLEAIELRHSPISTSLYRCPSERLQYIDSELLLVVLEACRAEGIFGLPIHDSIIVARSHERRTNAIMNETLEDLLGALKTVACNRRARTHWRAKPLPGLPWLQAGRMP
jgi:hypothetical protein